MIYKIQRDINQDNFDKIISKISKFYRFLYSNGSLYLALINFEKNDEAKEIFKKTFRPVKNFYVCEITENNLQMEDGFIIDWCRDAFVDLERQRYEIEQQEKLREVMSAMDEMEKILEQSSLQEELEKLSSKNFEKGGK